MGFQKTLILFPAHTRLLTTIQNFSYGGSNVLFWLLRAMHAHGAQTHLQPRHSGSWCTDTPADTPAAKALMLKKCLQTNKAAFLITSALGFTVHFC